MPARKKIPYKSSVMVRHVAPTNKGVEPNEPLNNTDDGSTCSFKAYDHDKDEVIAADESSGETVLTISNPAAFKVGDTVEVTQDDDSIHVSTLDAVTPADGTVTLADQLTQNASLGKRIRCRLGGVVTMAEYGTPKLGESDWGFEGLLQSDHAGLEIGVNVDIEISFVGDPANPGELDQLEVICGVVNPKEDCSEYS
jgi:hypothetical protein